MYNTLWPRVEIGLQSLRGKRLHPFSIVLALMPLGCHHEPIIISVRQAVAGFIPRALGAKAGPAGRA